MAEDLLQELALKLADSEGFATADRPEAYARAAAMNIAFSWRRRAKQEPYGLEDETSRSEPSPLERLVRGEQIERMLAALGELAERDRLVLTLRFLDQQSYREVSRELGCPAHQARAFCHRALRRLRDRLAARDEQDSPTQEVSR